MISIDQAMRKGVDPLSPPLVFVRRIEDITALSSTVAGQAPMCNQVNIKYALSPIEPD